MLSLEDEFERAGVALFGLRRVHIQFRRELEIHHLSGLHDHGRRIDENRVLPPWGREEIAALAEGRAVAGRMHADVLANGVREVVGRNVELELARTVVGDEAVPFISAFAGQKPADTSGDDVGHVRAVTAISDADVDRASLDLVACDSLGVAPESVRRESAEGDDAEKARHQEGTPVPDPVHNVLLGTTGERDAHSR